MVDAVGLGREGEGGGGRKRDGLCFADLDVVRKMTGVCSVVGNI